MQQNLKLKERQEDMESLMTEAQAADFLQFTPRFLQMRRLRGGGPKYVKFSARAVRYRRKDLIEWVEARIQSATCEG